MRPARCQWAMTKALRYRGRPCAMTAQFRMSWTRRGDGKRPDEQIIVFVCGPHVSAAARNASCEVHIRFKRANPPSYSSVARRRMGWPIVGYPW